MKIFKICLLFLISSSTALAVTPEEFEKIASQFKLIDNSKEKIPKTMFKTKDGNIDIYIEKQFFDGGLNITPPIIKLNEQIIFHEYNSWSGISNYNINHFATLCYSNKNEIFVTSVVSSLYLEGKQKWISYQNLIYNVHYNNPNYRGKVNFINYDLFKKLFNSSVNRIEIPYNPKEFFPYYNEEKILERLYETGTCDREITKEANIQVMVNGKWIPQEQSWNIKKERPNSKTKIIQVKKQFLYTAPNEKTKMYLIKGDMVTLLDEQTDDKGQKWYFINYKGKKDLTMWIKAEAVDSDAGNPE